MSTPFDTFFRLAEGRRSVREFTQAPVEDESIVRLLRAACQAPSAHNRQPWRFVVVRGAERKAALANAMAERLRTERTADGDPAAEVEADVARARRRLTDAPIAVVACLTPEDLDVYPDTRRQQAERTMAVQSVAMAGENLLLAAHAEGLGACWMCAPLFAPDVVRQELDLPSTWEPQGLVLIGHAAGSSGPRRRRTVDEVTRWA
jgi:coenzyme F420-0:L-glutamate ligase / coenzyme F420-1:gamma-L-glutamate ligase